MNIAIIGTGISGLTAAYVLNRKHKVTVYEANGYIGGHTHTVDVEVESGKYAIDTGFIVFNHRTYPNFVKLLDQLQVKEQDTVMSFGVKNEMTGLEYRASNLNSLFAQRSNVLRPSHWGMIMGMLRFGEQIEKDFETGNLPPDMTMGEYLRQGGYSDYLVDNFVLPMGSALWSAGDQRFQDFPVLTYAHFMNNHGMLTVSDHPQWKVIKGGSRSYIEPLIKGFKDRIRLNTPVEKVTRLGAGVSVLADGKAELFDHVIFSTHSDTALKILGDDVHRLEKEVLEALPYQRNEVILHTDTSILPENRRAWASWNYFVSREPSDVATVTYNMNMLQSIDAPETFLVSLNSSSRIDPDKILARFEYDHPVYSPAGQAAQKRWYEINGIHRTWFSGAYWRFGFHEDGVQSALRVTRTLAKESI